MRKIVYKICAVSLVLALALTFFYSFLPQKAFAEDSNPGDTVFDVGADTITLRNSYISLSWDIVHGTLVSLYNCSTQTEYLTGSDSCNWTLFIDSAASSKWDCSLGTQVRGKDAFLTNYSTRVTDGGIELSLLFDSVGGQDISVLQKIHLSNNDGVSSWTTSVSNNEDHTVVSAIISPQVTGLNYLQNEQLAWPWKEGQIFSDPGTDLRFMQYPVQASMQWASLYNDEESLYYGVLDSSASYKEFRFGYDSSLTPSSASPRQLSTTLWPFLEAFSTYESPVVEVGVNNAGGWYTWADRYRNWLINSAHWTSTPSQIASELPAWRTGFNKFYTEDTLRHAYADIPAMISSCDSYGIDMLELLGWHSDGFDSYYPDYAYLDNAGGATALANAIDTLHSNGDNVFFYINNHIADIGSNWFASNGAAAALKGIDGTPFLETYGNGRQFYSMCPSAENWTSQLNTVATGLKSIGADGIWWDQMMEMEAVLCYDSTHGHSSPATAFSEGYLEMMNTMRQAFSSDGLNYLFAAEGVCDYYSQFVDVCGMMWGRLPGYSSENAPELTRYTIPSRFLGLPTYGTTSGSGDEYGRAFLMGNILLVDSPADELPNENVFPRYINIYDAEPEIYYHGIYKAENGLATTNGNVLSSLIIGSDSDRIGIQLCNETDAVQTTLVKVSYGTLGLSGKCVAAVNNIENGTAISYQNANSDVFFWITIPAHDIAAIKVTLADTPNPKNPHYFYEDFNHNTLNVYYQISGSTQYLDNTRNIQLGESDSEATLYHELVRGQFSENIEVTGSIFLPGDDVRGAYDSAGIIATNADYSTKYLAVLWYGSNLEREFHITKQTDTDTFIATLPAPDVQLNNSHWVKIRIENGSIYAKYWLNDGQTLEPAAWMLTATLEPNWSATGGVGFVANATKTWAKWLWVTAA